MKINNTIQEKLSHKPEWLKLIPKDNRLWLLQSKESFTVYKTLTNLFDFSENEDFTQQAKDDMLKDSQVESMLSNLASWKEIKVTGHNDPRYIPNQLLMLYDWGLRKEDDPRIKEMLDTLLENIDENTGQFLWYGEIYARKTKEKKFMWESLLCDHHIITSLMILYGYYHKKEVKRGIERITELIENTENGLGWKCLPGIKTNFRGPGRKNEVCPMLIVDVLRSFYKLPQNILPQNLIETGKTLLSCWSERSTKKPYMFGHGRHFRTLRPPFFWYNVGSVIDAVSRYPVLVKTSAFKQLMSVALLSFNEIGKITPKSIKTYFKGYSFGQKKKESPWVTYYLSNICKRVYESNPKGITDIISLDGNKFKGSKGSPKKK